MKLFFRMYKVYEREGRNVQKKENIFERWSNLYETMLYHGGINLQRLLKIWLIYDEAYVLIIFFSFLLIFTVVVYTFLYII